MDHMAKVYDVGVLDAAVKLGLSTETIKRWARSGKLPAHKTISGRWMFNATDLAEVQVHAVVVDA